MPGSLHAGGFRPERALGVGSVPGYTPELGRVACLPGGVCARVDFTAGCKVHPGGDGGEARRRDARLEPGTILSAAVKSSSSRLYRLAALG